MNTNLLYVKVDDIKAEIHRRIDKNEENIKENTEGYNLGFADGIYHGLHELDKWLGRMETPKKSKVTKELREEVIEYMCGLYEDDGEPEEDGFYLFFKRCKDAGIDHGDADAYAWLNTLMGYDIGLEKAVAIDVHMFNEYGTPILELDYKKDSKNIVKAACYDLKMELDFSKWAKENPECYKYFEEE